MKKKCPNCGKMVKVEPAHWPTPFRERFKQHIAGDANPVLPLGEMAGVDDVTFKICDGSGRDSSNAESADV